jgi:hypothetical protein
MLFLDVSIFGLQFFQDLVLQDFVLCCTGMSPVVLMKIWNTYVVSRFLYGLEVQNPTKTDIKKLEQLQRNVCRQFQCLPERTSSIAVYVSFALAFADSHSSICFSIVESSLAIPKNKFIQYLSSVTSIGSAPVNA